MDENESQHEFFYHKKFEEGGGLKGAIDLKTAYLIVQYFNNDINKEISKITVKDQKIKIKKGISCKLQKIAFGIPNYSYEKVKLSFEPPDKIHINISDIEAWGFIKTYFKVALIHYTENVNMKIKNFIINADITIKTEEVDGKLYPNAEISKISEKYDFDMKLKSNFGKLVSLFKKSIKNVVTKEINKLLHKELKKLLKKGLNLIPKIIDVDKKKGYIIDYSLISPPIIENNFILFNSYARFINKNLIETQNIDNFTRPFAIPSYDLKGKSSQVFVSDYVINTALFTFFKTRDLELKLKPSDIPKNIPLIKLNTSWLNIIFKDLSSTYGMDKPVTIKLIVSENPKLVLKEDMISFDLPSNVELMIEGVKEVAVKFKTNFVVDVVLNIFENNKISGNIKSLNIQNTQIISSYTKDEDFGSKLEKQFNLMKGLVLPFINAFVLKNIKFKLPIIKGIKFTDLTVSHHNNFLIINYNFQYNEKENIPKEEKKNDEKKKEDKKEEDKNKEKDKKAIEIKNKDNEREKGLNEIKEVNKNCKDKDNEREEERENDEREEERYNDEREEERENDEREEERENDDKEEERENDEREEERYNDEREDKRENDEREEERDDEREQERYNDDREEERVNGESEKKRENNDKEDKRENDKREEERENDDREEEREIDEREEKRENNDKEEKRENDKREEKRENDDREEEREIDEREEERYNDEREEERYNDDREEDEREEDER